MVSTGNIIILGLVLVLLGFGASTLFRVRGPADLPKDTMEIPTVQPQNQLIQEINKVIGQVSKRIGKLEASFRPTGPKRVTGFPRGVFVSSLAGKSVITGFGPKASAKTRRIIGDVSGAAAAVDVNRFFLLNLRDARTQLRTLRTDIETLSV